MIGQGIEMEKDGNGREEEIKGNCLKERKRRERRQRGTGEEGRKKMLYGKRIRREKEGNR